MSFEYVEVEVDSKGQVVGEVTVPPHFSTKAEAYEEATYFARKCGLTRDEALRMMREAQSSPSMAKSSGGKRKN